MSTSAEVTGAGPVWARGTIKWYNDNRGYGFIVPSNGGPDVLLHIKRLAGKRVPRTRQDDGAAVVYIDRIKLNGKHFAEIWDWVE